jgi:hypothetical protein
MKKRRTHRRKTTKRTRKTYKKGTRKGIARRNSQRGGVFPYMPRDRDTVFFRSVGGVPTPVSAAEADAITDGREDVSD